ncbi:MAG: NADH dehydrogenase [ubiquinone] 1 alpha subcomplex assembly factor 1 [Cognaticolwellia sp.]|jgi:NADH dehydrogenase [ubiquinone] 1 alpha subcomplex assembly factor 1
MTAPNQFAIYDWQVAQEGDDTPPLSPGLSMLLYVLMSQLLAISAEDLKWIVVNDTVMGGVSTSSVSMDDSVRFIGELSLEQNGGFTSMRAPLPRQAMEETRAIRLTLRGDGRTYDFTLRRRDVPMRAGSYRVSVPTQAEDLTVVELPLAEFRPTSFGRPVAGAPALDTNLSRIDEVGFLLADKQPGPFALELISLELLPGATPRAAGHRQVIEGLSEAVSIGVPLFNKGDAAGCQATYTQALIQIRLHPALTAGEQALVAQALADAESLSAADAAWVLRGAIDSVLASAPS